VSAYRGYTYFRRRDFSIREGGGYPNLHISWKQPNYRLFFYLALTRRRKLVWLWR
jgi:hypothetical protein